MASRIKISTRGFDRAIRKLNNAGGKEFQRRMELLLEKQGFDFLDTVQNYIISMGVVDTRRLLNSFDKGNEDNIWEKVDGGLDLKVGTNVYYAWYVNSGHRLRNGKWWDGEPYWDNAVKEFRVKFKREFKDGIRRALNAILKSR